MKRQNSAWSIWKAYPDPRKGEVLNAPSGPGVYQVRHGKQMVLFGIGGACKDRMQSLLPAPLGQGTRNNKAKRAYMFENLAELEYRCLSCETRADAKEIEDSLDRNEFLFKT